MQKGKCSGASAFLHFECCMLNYGVSFQPQRLEKSIMISVNTMLAMIEVASGK
jgi:hypothetical protein